MRDISYKTRSFLPTFPFPDSPRDLGLASGLEENDLCVMDREAFCKAFLVQFFRILVPS